MKYYSDEVVTLYNGDCRVIYELGDETIQAICCSPPYWGLRKYAGLPDLVWGGKDEKCEHIFTLENKQTGQKHWNQGGKVISNNERTIHNGGIIKQGFCSSCGAWQGQLGLEPTPEMYIEHLVEIFREVKRILRKDGVVFLNIGDSYFGGGNNRGNNSPISDKQASNFGAVGQCAEHQKNIGKHPVLKPKDLCLIPFRLAIALQEDGWWVRSVIIWNKPNPMPESVTDRPTESHEYILMLTKSAKYYWDDEAVREKATRDWGDCGGSLLGHTGWASAAGRNDDKRKEGTNADTTGRNLRSVWTFPTQPYPEAHFATYPEKLVEICVKAASRRGDIVLDPFCGSGTTLAVAKRLGRQGIGYELSEQYCKLAVKRIEKETAPMRLDI